MSLEDVDIPGAGEVPSEVAAFLAAAEKEVEAYLRKDPSHGRVAGFVPSDYAAAYASLAAVAEAGLAPGELFCEWGSGFGVVASLASMLGFRAIGIENDPALVAASRALAERFQTGATFIEETYLPSGFDMFSESIGDSRQLVRTPGDAARVWEAELGLGVEDFDAVYVFPWPGEAQFIEELFDATASEGALLMLYEEEHGVRVLQRVVEETDADDVAEEDDSYELGEGE